MKPIIERVQEKMGHLESVEVPSLDEMLEGNGQKYPYNETFENAKRNPIVILHSSGSTGMLSGDYDVETQLMLTQVSPNPSR